MTITIHKAPPVRPGEEVPDLDIRATVEAPELVIEDETWEEQLREFYDGQAREIADRLWASLPQATLQGLLVEMLGRLRVLLRGRPLP